MAESIEEFFLDGGFESSEISEQATTIHAFLTDANFTADIAARSVMSSSQGHDTPILSKVVSQIIIPIAEERPETHEPLLKFMGQLKGLIETAVISLRPGDSISLNYELWEKGLRYGDPDPGNDLRDLYRQEWANINGFAALAHKTSLENLSAFGEHTLELALRRGAWRVAWRGSEGTSNQLDALQGHADAATRWILVCGRKIYHERESIRTHWAEWEQNLAWITEQDELKSDTKSLCEEALAEMRRISVRT